MFYEISSDALQHFCIIPNTKPKNLVLFTIQSALKTLPPQAIFLNISSDQPTANNQYSAKELASYHYYLNQTESKKTLRH